MHPLESAQSRFEHAQSRIAAVLASCLARAIRQGDAETVDECRRLLAGSVRARTSLR